MLVGGGFICICKLKLVNERGEKGMGGGGCDHCGQRFPAICGQQGKVAFVPVNAYELTLKLQPQSWFSQGIGRVLRRGKKSLSRVRFLQLVVGEWQMEQCLIFI